MKLYLKVLVGNMKKNTEEMAVSVIFIFFQREYKVYHMSNQKDKNDNSKLLLIIL